MRCIGSVITGTDEETQAAIDAGVIPELGKLLSSPKPTVRKEAAWALSNITAGTENQIQLVISNSIMERLIGLAIEDKFDVRRECIWCLSNTTSGANGEQIKLLIQYNIVEALCSILSSNDARTLAISLEGLDNVLKKSKILGNENLDDVTLRIEKCGGLKLLESVESY